MKLTLAQQQFVDQRPEWLDLQRDMANLAVYFRIQRLDDIHFPAAIIALTELEHRRATLLRTWFGIRTEEVIDALARRDRCAAIAEGRLGVRQSDDQTFRTRARAAGQPSPYS